MSYKLDQLMIVNNIKYTVQAITKNFVIVTRLGALRETTESSDIIKVMINDLSLPL